MEISFSDILQAGVGAISLFILYQVILLTARESERRDAAATADRERQDRDDERRDKSDERLMLLFASITGKQIEGTAQVIKSGVDSEGRLSAQVTTAEGNIKGRVTASGDANIAAIEKSYELLNASFKILLARPADPMAAARFDKAIEGLTAQMEAVKDDIVNVKADTAANTDARLNTAEMLAVVPTPDATAAATEGDEELDIAS